MNDKDIDRILDNINQWLLDVSWYIGLYCGYQQVKDHNLSKVRLVKPTVWPQVSWYTHYGTIGIQMWLKVQHMYGKFDSSLLLTGELLDITLLRRNDHPDSESIGRMSSIVNKRISKMYSNTEVICTFAKCACCHLTKICPTSDDQWLCYDCERELLKPSVDDSGYVYVYGSRDHNIFKIGCSRDPGIRVRAFSSEFPFSMAIEVVIEADNKREAEKALHLRFRLNKVRGEWYHLDSDDLGRIGELGRFEDGEFT